MAGSEEDCTFFCCVHAKQVESPVLTWLPGTGRGRPSPEAGATSWFILYPQAVNENERSVGPNCTAIPLGTAPYIHLALSLSYHFPILIRNANFFFG